MKSKVICIYHGNCDDGFTSAFFIYTLFRDNNNLDAIEFYPGVYQTPPPDVKDKHVIMADFSYKRDVMEKLVANSKSFHWLDHHKSAIEDMKDFAWRPQDVITLDLNRSGALICYDTLMVDKKYQQFAQYISDRDLWKFELPDTNAFSLSVRSHKKTFEIWEEISTNVPKLIADGKPIVQYYNNCLDEISRSAYEVEIEGHKVLVANCPFVFASDLANRLSYSRPFAACYFWNGKIWTFSLRSQNDGIDVTTIAKVFGGGGHKHAAGFSVDCLDKVFKKEKVLV